MYTFVLVIHVIVVVMLIVVILVQRGRGAGLVEALSSAESLFGTKTSSFLVKSTAILAGLFLITSLSLTSLSKKRSAPLTEKYKKILEGPAAQQPPLEPVKRAASKAAVVPERTPAASQPDSMTPVAVPASAEKTVSAAESALKTESAVQPKVSTTPAVPTQEKAASTQPSAQ